MLGVSVTALKQACRNLNIPKWPYKKGNDVRSGQQPPEIGNTLTQHLNNGSIGGTPASRAETTVPYVPPLAVEYDGSDLAFLVLPNDHEYTTPDNTDSLGSCEVINPENSTISLEDAKELEAQGGILKDLWVQAPSTLP